MLPHLTPGAPELGLAISSAPSGTLAIRSRASVSSIPPRGVIVLEHPPRFGWTTTATPSASAIASMVMSSWVGPIPPVVNR